MAQSSRLPTVFLTALATLGLGALLLPWLKSTPAPSPMAPSVNPSLPVPAPVMSGTDKLLYDRSQLAAVVGTLRGFTVLMTEYYFNQGEWPTDMAALGQDESQLSNSLIAQVRLMDGRLLALMKQGGWVGLRPELVMGGNQIEWRCETNVHGFVGPSCHKSDAIYSQAAL